MKLGRPPVGLAHVDRLEGPEELKERLRAVLGTITGEMSVEQACTKLAVGPSRLHAIRKEVLQGALEALAPARAGRPRSAAQTKTDRERELEQTVRGLEFDLRGSLARTEVALAMPYMIKRGSKKNSRSRKAKTRK